MRAGASWRAELCDAAAYASGARLSSVLRMRMGASAAPGEYRRIARLRPTLANFGWWQVARAMVALQRARRTADEQSMHCTYLDGREIPDADMEHVRDIIWKHLVITPWQRGDIVAIDNHSVAHGRLPFRGPRQVAVCWA